MSRKAIFIDKDGTLIPDIPYNINPDLITLAEGAEKLKALQDKGYLLIIVTNQAGVAKGYFETDKLRNVELKITELLRKNHVQLHGFFYCPHHPEGTVPDYAVACTCRKPENGMILEAAKCHDVDLEKSWMIGDILNDVEAGNKSGCRTILLDIGNETEWILNKERTPDYKAKHLGEALDIIFKTESVTVNEVGLEQL